MRPLLPGMTLLLCLCGSIVGFGCESSTRVITGDQSVKDDSKKSSEGVSDSQPSGNDGQLTRTESNNESTTPEVIDSSSFVAFAEKPSLKADDPEGKAALKKLGVEYDTDADGHVTEIKFPAKPIPKESWALLKNFRTIEILVLDETKITDADLVHVTDFPRLLELSLQGNPITDKGLESIKGMKQLETLALAKTKVTGKGVASIAGMTKLKRLNLSYCPIGDAPLKHLSSMKDLETLALQKSGVTGPGLEYVGKLKNMITLNLDETKLKGDSFLHLKGLSKLRIITFYDSEASAASIRKLESEIPTLAIFQ